MNLFYNIIINNNYNYQLMNDLNNDEGAKHTPHLQTDDEQMQNDDDHSEKIQKDGNDSANETSVKTLNQNGTPDVQMHNTANSIAAMDIISQHITPDTLEGLFNIFAYTNGGRGRRAKTDKNPTEVKKSKSPTKKEQSKSKPKKIKKEKIECSRGRGRPRKEKVEKIEKAGKGRGKSQTIEENEEMAIPEEVTVQEIHSQKTNEQFEDFKDDSISLKPLTRDLCEQFDKVNNSTILWQQNQQPTSTNKNNSKNSPNKQSQLETMVQSTYIYPFFLVYLIESNYLLQLRNYFKQTNQIFIDYQIQHDTKPPKTKSNKKSKKQKEEPAKIVLSTSLANLMKEFKNGCGQLTNRRLVKASSNYINSKYENEKFSFMVKDANCKEKGLNVYARHFITYQTDYEIILPALHDFITNPRNYHYFNVNIDKYIAVPRRYRRLKGKDALKTELEVHYIPLRLHIQQNKPINTQIQMDLDVQQACNKIWQITKDYVDKPRNQYKFILDDQNVEINDDLVPFKKLFNKIENLMQNKKWTVNVYIKEKRENEEMVELKKVYDKCNYCRNPTVSTNSDDSSSDSNDDDQLVYCHCRQALYCSQECLTKDIPFHKQQCLKEIKTLQDWNNDRTDVNILQERFFKRRGLIGLQNLTNSCYMNCTLQCLSHCKALSNYFLSGKFIEELNSQNPLGSQGLLALAYGQVMKQLWSGEYPIVAPIYFKFILSRFKKQFANTEQQDSQELLTIILDSLHEDLNRVKVKPLVPTIESHGEDDSKASLESWEAHLKRSQSIIVDLMHGQFKSTVRCPEPDCNHLSITFEPFMNISLPIPEIKLVTKQFIWVPIDISKKCSVHKFTIKGHESIQNLRMYITNEILTKYRLCYKENGFEIVQIQSDKIQRIMSHQNMAMGLQSSHSSSVHLFIYEIKDDALQTKEKQIEPKIDYNNTGLEIEQDQNIPIVQEISNRVKENQLMSVMNFEIIDYGFQFFSARTLRVASQSSEETETNEKETYFPRLTYLDLDVSLIQIHLQVFEHLKFLFTRFLEHRDWYHHNHVGTIHETLPDTSTLEDSLFLQKMSMKIPLHLTLDKWKRMTLSEQYEIVFSQQQNFKDPSRRKPQELPYFVRVVSRKMKVQNSCFSSSEDGNDAYVEHSRDSNSQKAKYNKQHEHSLKCIYCFRKNCGGCPLPFEDKITLRSFLTKSKSNTKSTYYYCNDDDASTNLANFKTKLAREQKNGGEKKVSDGKKSQKKGQKVYKNDELVEDDNLDFEILVQFNKNQCWGLYELLIRGQNQKQIFFDSVKKAKKGEVDQYNPQLYNKVTIADCFRQFDRPEKLSWQNEWYCDQCKAHKQAVKKIQVYKTPPVLIITLKRFKGALTNQKQNTPVHYPVEGLNMKNFMIPQLNEDNQIYDLFGVVLHTGTLNGGHYTAICKNVDDWYEFNDSQVIKLQQHELNKIVSNHAYILFYQKRGIDFDNIIDYDKIKNGLNLTDNGKEVFQPGNIEFPLDMMQQVEDEPIKTIRCNKNYKELVSQMSANSDSDFQEVNHKEKPKSYLEWIEEEFDLKNYELLPEPPVPDKKQKKRELKQRNKELRENMMILLDRPNYVIELPFKSKPNMDIKQAKARLRKLGNPTLQHFPRKCCYQQLFCIEKAIQQNQRHIEDKSISPFNLNFDQFLADLSSPNSAQIRKNSARKREFKARGPYGPRKGKGITEGQLPQKRQRRKSTPKKFEIPDMFDDNCVVLPNMPKAIFKHIKMQKIQKKHKTISRGQTGEDENTQ